MSDKNDLVTAPGIEARSIGGWALDPAGVHVPTDPMSMGDAMEMSWREMSQAWASVFDDETEILHLPLEEQRQIIGDRPIEPDPSVTRGELQRRISLHDFRQQYEGTPEGWKYMVGYLGPQLLSPVSVGSMLLGAPPALALAGKLTAGAGLVRTAVTTEILSGAAVGAASVPLEMHFSAASGGEQATFGQAVAYALGPEAWILSALPVSFAVGKSIRARRLNAAVTPAQQTVAQSAGVPDHAPPTGAAVDAAQTMPAVESPVPHVAPQPAAPRTKLAAVFEGYEGGVGKAVRDLAAGVPAAREYFKNVLRVDPDSEAIQEFLSAAAKQTQQVAQVAPDARAQVLRDIDAGKVPDGMTPEQAAPLRAPRAPEEVVTAVPTYTVGARSVDLLFGSEIDKALYLSGRDARAPAARQFLADMGFTKEQISAGAKKVRGKARTAAQKATGETAPVGMTHPMRPPEAVRTARDKFLSEGAPGGVGVFSARALVEAIETARMTGSSVKTSPRTPDPTPDAMMNTAFADDPRFADALEQASKHGVDVNAVRSLMDDVTEAMAQCPIT